jgi:thiol-disulfide isomerase/thioredoxin
VSLFSLRRHAPLPAEGHLPGFDGATRWLNSPPLRAEDLRGKVVLVDFWTYTCINWLRTLAYVRAWAEKYQDRGLVVVGVHTPEFPFEQDVDNVRQAATEMNVWYPIALDSDYAVWRAFSNRYWPAVYIADAEGRIRHHQFGEGGYDDCERAIQQLLREAGVEGVDDDLVFLTPDGFEAQADWTNLRSPETYLGYAQGRNFASRGFRSAFTLATFTSSWVRLHPARRCRSACSSTANLPERLVGSTSTRRAMGRSPNSGCISWFASEGRSPTAHSRSPSSPPAPRASSSHSARRY